MDVDGVGRVAVQGPAGHGDAGRGRGHLVERTDRSVSGGDVAAGELWVGAKGEVDEVEAERVGALGGGECGAVAVVVALAVDASDVGPRDVGRDPGDEVPVEVGVDADGVGRVAVQGPAGHGDAGRGRGHLVERTDRECVLHRDRDPLAAKDGAPALTYVHSCDAHDMSSVACGDDTREAVVVTLAVDASDVGPAGVGGEGSDRAVD